MRRKKISWRILLGRTFAYLIIMSANIAGMRALPENVYRTHPPVYVLKPATWQPSIEVSVKRRIEDAKKPKRVTNELLCLAQVIWFESAFEPREGLEAVAAVVFNRTQSKYYPRTICGVVYQSFQFSWTADYAKWSYVPSKKYMDMAKTFLRNRAILRESYENITHFHHVSISPAWSKQLQHVKTYGQHKFYAHGS